MLLPSWGARCDRVATTPAGAGALLPWPLPPDAVLDGSPSLRGCVLSAAADGTPTGGVWEVDACRLEVVAPGDALLAVLAGEVIIQTDDGATVQLDEGEAAWLPGGVTYVLTVAERCRVACHASTAGAMRPAPDGDRRVERSGPHPMQVS